MIPARMAQCAAPAVDLQLVFAGLKLDPFIKSVCAVLAVTEPESSLDPDPPVPNLASVARNEVLRRAEGLGVPELAGNPVRTGWAMKRPRRRRPALPIRGFRLRALCQPPCGLPAGPGRCHGAGAGAGRGPDRQRRAEGVRDRSGRAQARRGHRPGCTGHPLPAGTEQRRALRPSLRLPKVVAIAGLRSHARCRSGPCCRSR